MAGALGGVGALAGGRLLNSSLTLEMLLVGLSPLWKLLPGCKTEA